MKMQNRFGNWWYEDDVCRKDGCNTLINSCDNGYSIGLQGNFEPKRTLYCRDHYYSEIKKRDVVNNPRRNAISKIAYQIVGGSETYYKKSRDERLLVRKEATKRYLLNERPAEEVLAHIGKRVFPKLEDRKPKFNQGKYKSPLARAVAKGKVKQSPGFAREGPGFVYVYEDEMKMPGVLKIGSTQYSNGRLASANTWGAFTCLYEKEFERRYEAEDMVHDILGYCRIYRDKEWFRVTLTVAIEAIGEVRIDIRKKQKMG